MTILFPFFILSILSYFIGFKYKISSARAYLITSFSIILLLIFFGKFGYIDLFNELIRYFAISLLIYLIWKKKFDSEYIKNLIFFFIIYLFLIFVCKDLFYYKYDEFSEYGITTKLIFTENNLPSNIDYLQKGSHHKINFISYFHYFFLKNSSELFQESTTYLAHSFFIIIILFNILNYIKIQNIKKFFIFLLFYFLIYTLGPGFDRLYLDTIVGLIIALFLLTSFKKNKYKSDYLLIFLLTLILPIIKPNGILIVIGLSSLILIENVFKKKFTVIGIMLISLLSHHLVSEFYFSDLNIKYKTNKVHDIHESSAFNLTQAYQINDFRKNIKLYDLNAEFIYKFSNKQLDNLFKNGIYHSKTFLIFNKIFSKIDLNLQLVEIPVNIFVWLSIIILITFFINKKKNIKDLYLISTLYLGFVTSYYFILIFWGIKHNLITNDFDMNVSWERHLGSLVMGIIFFLFIKLFKIYKSFKIIFLFLFLSVCISLPNSLRLFMPNYVINNDIFWKNKIEERAKVNFISQEISSKIDDYSNLLLAFHKNDQPYFEQILNYELIKFNTMNIDARNIVFFPKFYDPTTNNNKFYLVKDNKYDLIKIKSKLNNIFNNVSDYKNVSLIKKYKIDHLEIYEIIVEK